MYLTSSFPSNLSLSVFPLGSVGPCILHLLLSQWILFFFHSSMYPVNSHLISSCCVNMFHELFYLCFMVFTYRGDSFILFLRFTVKCLIIIFSSPVENFSGKCALLTLFFFLCVVSMYGYHEYSFLITYL